MHFVKVLKNAAYLSRFQTKFRRRREGKTDYKARKGLITQNLRKGNTPKHRLVVRVTNKDIVCQVIDATITGDRVLCSAYAHELPKYGVPVGLTNYASAFAVGLLLARRFLTTLDPGNKPVDGLESVEAADGDQKRPMKCHMDVGLAKASKGAKVFGVMKGALDRGLDIPHSEDKWPGFNDKTKELDATVLRRHIFGLHVADYMEKLRDEDVEVYKQCFSQYIKHGIKPQDVEVMYAGCHAAIRADPTRIGKKKMHKKDQSDNLNAEHSKPTITINPKTDSYTTTLGKEKVEYSFGEHDTEDYIKTRLDIYCDLLMASVAAKGEKGEKTQ